ncbi:MAG: hypothetical protein IJS01_01665 [Lentisphaeria bacterium]|nr:hypothetical protein [Lentisphaeria bacterium]
MKKRFVLPLVIFAASAAWAGSIEERVVFYDSFCKGKMHYQTHPWVLNRKSLDVSEDGVVCGRGHVSPVIRVDPKVWDCKEGAIAFAITPTDWSSPGHDKEFTLLYSVLKNHGKTAAGFNPGDVLSINKLKRNAAGVESISFQGQNGAMTKHRAVIINVAEKNYKFEQGKTTRFALIWKNGGDVRLYLDGKEIGKGNPFVFPTAEKLAYLQLLAGAAKEGWGVLAGTCRISQVYMIRGKTDIAELDMLMRTGEKAPAAPPSAAAGKQGGGSSAVLPVIPFPQAAASPKQDGRIEKGEYPFGQSCFLHDGSGQIANYPAAFHTASDGENLYFAVDFFTRDVKYVPVSSSNSDDASSLVATGDLAVWFSRTDTDAELKGYDGPYITIAPNGKVYDCYEHIDWGKGGLSRDTKYASGIRVRSLFSGGRWILEAVLPLKALGLSEKKDFLFSFGLQIANKRYLLKPHTLWFDNVDAFILGRFTKEPVRFELASPAAGKVQGNLTTSDEAQVKLFTATSRTSFAGMVVDQVFGESTAYTPVKELGDWKGGPFSLPEALRGLHLMTVEAREPGRGTVYRRSLPFLARSPMEISLNNNPVKQQLSVLAEFLGVTPEPGEKLELSLLDTSGKTVAGRTVVLDASVRGECTVAADTAKLAPGKYTVRVDLSNRVSAQKEWVKKPLPGWLTHPEAMEALEPDWVPAPWTPVEVAGNKISVWGREFTFGPQGLEKITSLGETVVEAPLALVYTAAGKEHRLPLTSGKIRRIGRGRVEVPVSGSDENLEAHFTHTIEFDGLDTVAFTVDAKKKDLVFDGMYLELAAAGAKYFHTLYDYVSQELGPVESKPLMRMNAVWLGGEYRGVNTFFENSKTLKIDSRRPRFHLVKKEGDRAVLKIMLVNTPSSLDRRIDYRFGLHPTPLRPLYKDWENERIFVMEWFAPPFNLITLHTHHHTAASTALSPRNWELGKALGNLARTNKQKLYPYTIPTFASREIAIRPEPGYRRIRVADDWFYPVGNRPANQDLEDFFADWSFDPVSTFPGDGARHTEMVACSPAGSWSHYAVHKMSEYVRRCGLSGFLFDLTTSRENLDPARGYRYTTLDGKTEGTRELFASRDFYKRLYYAIGKLTGGREPYMFAHGYPNFSGSSSFWGLMIHGEQFKPKRMFALTDMVMLKKQKGEPLMRDIAKGEQPDYSGELLRLMYSPYRWGMPLVHVSQYALNRPLARDRRSGREMIALCFPNNILFDASYAYCWTGEELHMRVTIPFDMRDTVFHGYWENEVKTNAPFVKVSYWQHKKDPTDVLLCVANWSKRPFTAEVELPAFLVKADYVLDMENPNRMPVWHYPGEKWQLTLPACDLRIFRFIGCKTDKAEGKIPVQP